MKQKILRTTATGVLALATTTLHAEQAGSGHYISGATASFIDAAPSDPGLAVMNIFLDYNDANFDASHGLPFGSSIALNVNANIQAEIPVAFRTFTQEILGAHYTVGASLPYIWQDVKATGTIAMPGDPVEASKSDWTTGIGDIEFWPMILGWKQGDFKYDVRLAVYAPSGQYESDEPANAGLGYRNHWFWVDDRDWRSKRALIAIMFLFTMTQETGDQAVLLITIPAQ